MKITRVEATPVLVPLKQPLRWSFGTELSTVRTIIQLHTDEGIVGIGETRGGAAVAAAVRSARALYEGVDPLEVSRIAKRFAFYRVTSEQLDLIGAMKLAGAGVEMACWDAIGKALDKRCGDLWGGIERERVEVAAYAFYRYDSEREAGGGARPEGAAEHAQELVETYGFRDVKLKNGVLDPDAELRTVELIRDRLGSRLRRLRIDPNQAWSVETSIRFLRAVDGPDIEFCEDPTWGIEGMSRVRERVGLPLATNMCCVSFEQLPLAVGTRAIDVLLGDVHFWGGPSAVIHLVKHCESFNLGISLHSDRELGISTAAMLHLAAAQPLHQHAIDSHLPEQDGDVIAEDHVFTDGTLPVPDAPGLGVELDPDRLAHHAALHEARGEADEFTDPLRPGWSPTLPVY